MSNRRNFTLSLKLSPEAAAAFDKANYEYDSYFLDAVCDSLSDFLQARIDVSAVVINTAVDVENHFNEMAAEDEISA